LAVWPGGPPLAHLSPPGCLDEFDDIANRDLFDLVARRSPQLHLSNPRMMASDTSHIHLDARPSGRADGCAPRSESRPSPPTIDTQTLGVRWLALARTLDSSWSSEDPARAGMKLIGAVLGAFAAASCTATTVEQQDVLFRRVTIIGTQHAIASDPDGSKSITAYGENIYDAEATELVTADPRPPPPPCGQKIAQHFLDHLVERFNVLALNACTMGPSKVSCPTNYLPSPYKKTFFDLEYIHIPRSKVKLELNVYYRKPAGALTLVSLEESDRQWYNKLYKTLRELAYCH
jgi:hypothetical protein